MDEVLNVFKRDPKVQKRDMLDKYKKLPCNYQSKI